MIFIARPINEESGESFRNMTNHSTERYCMEKSLKIIKQIENMLEERNIEFEKMQHLAWIRQRAEGKKFSMSEHIRGLIYSLLSNNRPWEPIERNIELIDEIFFYYDKDKILETSPDYFIERLLSIKCGNRNIKNQMNALHDNIHQFEKIEKEFGTIDYFVTSGTAIEIADLLANNLKYKLRTVGLALAMEYLRNVGIDAIKPDVHICRILGKERLGYSQMEIANEKEAVNIIDKMAKESGYLSSQIDAILWMFCSDGNGMICTKHPHCEICQLKDTYCNYKQQEKVPYYDKQKNIWNI